MKLIGNIFNSRLWTLFIKELNQIKRSRELIVSLVVPPTVQVLIFGFALDPLINHMKLGVVDESRTVESREVVSALTANSAFDLQSYYVSQQELTAALTEGKLDAGVVFDAKFSEKRSRGETADVQMLFNGVNTNSGTIAQGYATRIIQEYNQRKLLEKKPSHNDATLLVTPRIALLYNPGLISSWFIVTGIIGVLLILNSSLVSASALTREKQMGTIEQLLMTPANTTEIIIAKIAPLFILLMVSVTVILIIMTQIFRVPVRGSLPLLLVSCALCVMCGIGIGTFIATFTKNATQAQLMSFFTNPPIAMLSGATTPVEAMPQWIQPYTYLNPVRHFVIIVRSIMLKGSGSAELYLHFLALLAFAIVLFSLSVTRFRKQLT